MGPSDAEALGACVSVAAALRRRREVREVHPAGHTQAARTK
jgi:hypothetical protein